jgi:hypothetical protein
MPAREIHFTFDTKVKVNKNTILEFVSEYEYHIREHFENIKHVFNVTEINQDFLKQFIKELKGFDSLSIDGDYTSDKQRIIKEFVYDQIGNETKEGDGILKVRYLYDEWEYEGCGSNDHYYLTFTDDVKMIKKTIKEFDKLVEKLTNLGVKVEFKIEK